MASKNEFEELDQLLQCSDCEEEEQSNSCKNVACPAEPVPLDAIESIEIKVATMEITAEIIPPDLNPETTSKFNENAVQILSEFRDPSNPPSTKSRSRTLSHTNSESLGNLESLSTIVPLLDMLEDSMNTLEDNFPTSDTNLKDKQFWEPAPQVIRRSRSKKSFVEAGVKKSIENILKGVGSQVKKQLSLTSFKKSRRHLRIYKNMGRNLSNTDILSLPKTYPNLPKIHAADTERYDSDTNFSTPVMSFDWDPTQHSDINFMEGVEFEKFLPRTCDNKELIWSLPDDQPSITVKLDNKDSNQLLTFAIKKETESTKSKYSTEWNTALLNREMSTPKDFRRIFVYIIGKVEMPGKKILCLVQSPQGNNLAIGGELGMLKLLEVKYSSNFMQTEDPKVNDIAYQVLRNENLKGHMFDVERLTWHSSGDRFTTSDSNGIIISWMNCDGLWTAELVQDKNSSKILGISWSTLGTHVCFTYRDTKDDEKPEYGIVMGFSDGSRKWNLGLGDSFPSSITWIDETKFAIFYDSTIYVYHCNGQQMQKRCIIYEDGSDTINYKNPKSQKVIAFIRKDENSWTAAGTFSLAIVWEFNRMMLLRDINDRGEAVILTRLKATCASWSPNGLFIAIGGNPTRIENFSQVNIFSYVGKLLTIIKIREPSLSSISWDLDSFHLSIGANNLLYFGRVRPLYKFASNGYLFAYAFSKDGENFVGFWDGQKVTIQTVPGTIVDLRSHEGRFVLLSVSDKGIYSVSLLNKLGVSIETLCILTMEPFAACLTESCLICLSSSSILFWKYGDSFKYGGLRDHNSNRKNIRQVHIDDSPSMIPNVGEGTEHFSKFVIDPAICMDAKSQYLCIARSSGKLQFYHLPQGGIFLTFEFENFNPYLILFNPVADRLALLDMDGCLSFGTMNKSTIEIKQCKATTEVLNIIWAKDLQYHLCVMERTQMYILRDGKVEETFLEINALHGYLAGFDNLEITLVKLDDILQTPDQPSSNQLIKVDLQIIARTKSDLIDGDRCKLEKLVEAVEKRNHLRLWRLLGKGALARRKLSIAEIAFVKCKNYPGLMLLKKIKEMTNVDLQRAEIFCFLEEYTKAEESYLKTNRKDLAIKMWKQLGDFPAARNLTNKVYGGGDNGNENLDPSKLVVLSEKHMEMFDIEAALVCFKKLKDFQKMLDCYMMLDDFEGLKGFAETLTKKHTILPQIAVAFAAIGMTTDAVKAYLLNEDPQSAVTTALNNFQWNLALEVSQTHNIPIVAPVLLNYAGQMIKAGDILQAVQLLERSDKTFAAGKLLAMMGLLVLRNNEQPSLESVKKLFVMAGIMLTKKPKKFFKSKLKQTSTAIEDDIDLKFDESIPECYRPTSEDLHWMRETPWKGAHGVHYLTLAQRQIQRGHFDKATKAANHLRNFCDILGEERVNCMIALAAANGSNFYICSGAFYQLKCLDEEYSDIALELFRDKTELADKKTRSIKCSCCESKLPDYQAGCENCGHTFPICIITGNILSIDGSVWKCRTCGGTADLRKVKRVEFCPLCHETKACPEG